MLDRKLVPTATRHVYLEPSSGLFYFEDETHDVENGSYLTEVLAAEALASYVEWALRPREA